MSRGDRHTTAPKYRVRALGGFDSRLGCERSRVRFPDGPCFISALPKNRLIVELLSMINYYAARPVSSDG